MTRHVLRATAQLNLRSIRAEVQAAHDEHLISTEDTEAILQAHALLTTLIANACDAPRAGRDDDEPPRAKSSSGEAASRSQSAPTLVQGSGW